MQNDLKVTVEFSASSTFAPKPRTIFSTAAPRLVLFKVTFQIRKAEFVKKKSVYTVCFTMLPINLHKNWWFLLCIKLEFSPFKNLSKLASKIMETINKITFSQKFNHIRS